MRGTRATIVFVVAMVAAVAACGSSGHSSAKPPAQLPIASTVPGGQPTVRDCGTLRLGAGNVELVDGRKDATACFAASFAQCKPATLHFTKHGVDTGDEHLFRVVLLSGVAPCGITDDFQHYGAVRALNKSATYPCTGLQSVGAGVVIHGCGQAGDVAIPAVGTR